MDNKCSVDYNGVMVGVLVISLRCDSHCCLHDIIDNLEQDLLLCKKYKSLGFGKI